MKPKCVICSSLVTNYQEHGNYCVWCDAKCSITKKTNIKWFFQIARALHL